MMKQQLMRKTMPILHLYSRVLPLEKKQAFAQEATQALVETLNADATGVKIMFNEYSAEQLAAGGKMGGETTLQAKLEILEGRNIDQRRKAVAELTTLAMKYFNLPARIFLQEMSPQSYSIDGKFKADH